MNSLDDSSEADLFYCCLQIIADSLAMVSSQEIGPVQTVETMFCGLSRSVITQLGGRDPSMCPRRNLNGRGITERLGKQKITILLRKI